MRHQPREPFGGPRQLEHLQTQARPGQRAAVGAQRLAAAGGQLLEDVADDAVVGGGRRPEHRDSGRERVEHVLHAPVVRAEVMPPVGDAVRLVDHQQPDRRGEQRQHPLPETRVVQPLGADQQQVDRVRRESLADVVPLLAVGAVDRVRAQPQPLRRGDLVAHQRQQRADDQRRPRTRLAQQRGRDEIQRGLSPSGALHAQHPRAVDDDIPDRLQLPRPEPRAIVAGQRAQALQRNPRDRLRGHGRHRAIVSRAPEGSGSAGPLTAARRDRGTSGARRWRASRRRRRGPA